MCETKNKLNFHTRMILEIKPNSVDLQSVHILKLKIIFLNFVGKNKIHELAKKKIEKFENLRQKRTNRCQTKIIQQMDNSKIYKMLFSSVYPLYINKVERKGRTKEELDTVVFWLTGYDEKTLQQQIEAKSDFETFFAQAPNINPNASKITGVICGYRVEEIEDKVVQQVRYLDKLVDEIAKGRKMEKILRE